MENKNNAVNKRNLFITIAAVIQSFLYWFYSMLYIGFKKSTRIQRVLSPSVIKAKKKQKRIKRSKKRILKPKRSNSSNKLLLTTIREEPTTADDPIVTKYNSSRNSWYTVTEHDDYSSKIETASTASHQRKRDRAKQVLFSTFTRNKSPSWTSSIDENIVSIPSTKKRSSFLQKLRIKKRRSS